MVIASRDIEVDWATESPVIVPISKMSLDGHPVADSMVGNFILWPKDRRLFVDVTLFGQTKGLGRDATIAYLHPLSGWYDVMIKN